MAGLEVDGNFEGAFLHHGVGELDLLERVESGVEDGVAGEADQSATLEEAVWLLVSGGGPRGVLRYGGEGGGGPGFLEEDEVGLQFIDLGCDVGVAGGGGAVHPAGESPDIIDEELEVGGGCGGGGLGECCGRVPDSDRMRVWVAASGEQGECEQPEQQDGSGGIGGCGPNPLGQQRHSHTTVGD